jgi:hypothetical protein
MYGIHVLHARRAWTDLLVAGVMMVFPVRATLAA